MKKLPVHMPLSERFAPQILAQEGFREIHWASLINWRCHYDFTATKSGRKYLIEVKPSLYSIDREKVQHLKNFKIPVLFLIINPAMKEYVLLPLETLEAQFGESIVASGYGVTVQSDGRTTIPNEVRKALDIYGQKAFCEIETYGEDKALIRVMSRWTPTHRGPGKDVVKKP